MSKAPISDTVSFPLCSMSIFRTSSPPIILRIGTSNRDMERRQADGCWRSCDIEDILVRDKTSLNYAVTSRWGKANGYKEWRYLFIPTGQIWSNSSFMQLAERFKEMK